jgi:hypothetical protein
MAPEGQTVPRPTWPGCGSRELLLGTVSAGHLGSPQDQAGGRSDLSGTGGMGAVASEDKGIAEHVQKRELSSDPTLAFKPLQARR